MLQVRSKLELSAVLWHFGLSGRNRNSLERVQKSALKVILGKKYTSYNNALKELNIDSLQDRRESLCLKFAKKCLKVTSSGKCFPKSLQCMKCQKTRRSIFGSDGMTKSDCSFAL